MRYIPKQKDGSVVPLPWPVAIYRRWNHLAWPLEDDATRNDIWLDRLGIFVGFLIFCLHNEVDFHYLLAYRHDIDKMLEGMPTYLILVEMQIRCFHLALNKQSFKQLLKQFYANFYVTPLMDSALYEDIQRQMQPTRFNSLNYLAALLNFGFVPVLNIIYNRREMLYKQVYLFDNTVWYFYYPLIACNYWVGIVIDSMLFGELNVLGEFMMHLNARYIILSRDLESLAARCITKNKQRQHLAYEFKLELKQLLRRHFELTAFVASIEKEFSLRIFFSFSFSTGLLCALGFKAYTNPLGSLVYIFWFAAKFFELLAFGMLGSTLQKTTDNLSTMYYSCGWEQIMYHSPNEQENVLMMKLVKQAVQINATPVSLSGLNYFHVTLEAVVTIIQGAFSYFAFLKSMR
ncbi:odorant receptor 74a [Drosophila busckii]|uniref:odorant receptor 74a n=1 Tax=Drosophila busckii TaxID=30019 RepID=UPI00083E9D97|nr:odorant receptor 74a [Drosophila busckii]